MKVFSDRFEAGRVLASKLGAYRERPNALVLALPRGGVPVAYEIAKELHVDMDVFLVRKLGVPGNEELAMGAIASGGIRILSEDIIGALRISEVAIDAITSRERRKWKAASSFTGKGDGLQPCLAGVSSLSMMASRQELLCGLRCKRCASTM